MSALLAIDTSTSRTSVALIADNQVLWSEFEDGVNAHAEAVPRLVQRALLINNEISRVIVGMGPGPFTGLRVGISFAHTFGLARNIPVIGVCSLDAIAINESEYTVAIDARRKEIYWARYKDGVRIEGPSVSKPAEVDGFIIDQYPDMKKLVSLSSSQNVTEPMYLRRPDAVPTAERT